MSPKAVESRIRAAIPDAEVEVIDDTGTGDHFTALVITPAFSGKSLVERHQLVYRALADVLETGVIHALALKTFTPEEWRETR